MNFAVQVTALPTAAREFVAWIRLSGEAGSDRQSSGSRIGAGQADYLPQQGPIHASFCNCCVDKRCPYGPCRGFPVNRNMIRETCLGSGHTAPETNQFRQHSEECLQRHASEPPRSFRNPRQSHAAVLKPRLECMGGGLPIVCYGQDLRCGALHTCSTVHKEGPDHT